MSIAVDANFVYWGTDGSAVAKKAIDNSGSVTPLAQSQYAYTLALASNKIYWANDWEQDQLRYCPLPGCAGGYQGLNTGLLGIQKVYYAPSVQRLFWIRTDYNTGGTSVLRSYDLGSGSIQTVKDSGTILSGLAVDGSYVYWADKTAAKISKMPAAGGTVTDLMTNGAYANNVVVAAVDAQHYFWGTYRASNSDPGRPLYALSLPSGIGAGTPTMIGSGGQDVAFVVSDGKNVYWDETKAGGIATDTIYVCPVTGCSGSPGIAASGQTGAWPLAVDSQALYWGNSDGSVMKLAK